MRNQLKQLSSKLSINRSKRSRFISVFAIAVLLFSFSILCLPNSGMVKAQSSMPYQTSGQIQTTDTTWHIVSNVNVGDLVMLGVTPSSGSPAYWSSVYFPNMTVFESTDWYGYPVKGSHSYQFLATKAGNYLLKISTDKTAAFNYTVKSSHIISSGTPQEATPYSQVASIQKADTVWHTISDVKLGDLVVLSVTPMGGNPSYWSLLYFPNMTVFESTDWYSYSVEGSHSYQFIAGRPGNYLLKVSTSAEVSFNYTVKCSHRLSFPDSYNVTGTLQKSDNVWHVISNVGVGDLVVLSVSPSGGNPSYWSTVFYPDMTVFESTDWYGYSVEGSHSYQFIANKTGSYVLKISTDADNEFNYTIKSSHQLSMPTSDSSLSTSPTTGSSPSASTTGTLRIRLYVDGYDEIYIQHAGGVIWFKHLEWGLPGDAEASSSHQVGLQCTLPTTVNGVDWYPYWPTGNDSSTGRQYDDAGAESDRFVATGLYPSGDWKIDFMDVVQARNSISIEQDPSSSNDYTAIIKVSDTSAYADWYEFVLSWSTSSQLTQPTAPPTSTPAVTPTPSVTPPPGQPSVSGSTWPMFRQDPSHAGYSPSTAPDTNNVLWTYSIDFGDNASMPIVADGRVFFGSDSGEFYCLNASNGNYLWSSYTSSWISADPVVYGADVYFGSSNGFIYCFDEAYGTQMWSISLAGDAYPSSPLTIVNDVLFFGDSNGTVYALSSLSGNGLWTFQTGEFIDSAPAVVDGKVYVGSENGVVYQLDASTGLQDWSFPTGSFIVSAPSVVDGKVYVGSWDNCTYCLDADTGEEIWSYMTGGYVSSSPSVVYQNAYVGSYDGNVYCFEATSGDVQWTFPTDNAVVNSPAVADGKVYVASYDGYFYCIDASTGSLVWKYLLGTNVFTSAAIAYGNVYVCSDDKVYAFGSLEQIQTPSPSPSPSHSPTHSTYSSTSPDATHKQTSITASPITLSTSLNILLRLLTVGIAAAIVLAVLKRSRKQR
jgi:outer membrane protein assembly factor BamB